MTLPHRTENRERKTLLLPVLLKGPTGAALLCAAVLLAVYGATLAPSLTWAHYGADGGDLVTAVARRTIPHPPGFPTYLLLGDLFMRLPWGEPAWRLNLLSALLAAAAAGLTAAAVRRLLQPGANVHPALVHCAALVAGLGLGLAPLFWSQALIAEVYAPAAFFSALVLLLTLQGRPAWLLGLLWGIGLGVHPVLLFLAPFLAGGIWTGSGQALPGRSGRRGWRLVQAGLLALLGWGAAYGPLLLVRGGVPSPWGEVGTPGGWWALVSGRLYQGYLFGLPWTAWPGRLLAWAVLLVRQFTPLGAVLAGLGGVQLWKERKVLAGTAALSFGAWSLYAIGYNTADSLVYLVPALPLAALFLGVGLLRAATWLRSPLRWAAAGMLLLPLLQGLLFWGQMDLSGKRQALEWAQRVLREAPPRATLLTAQDAHTFTLWYVHDLLGERSDVVVVDLDLWGQEPYRQAIAESLGLAATRPDLPPEEAARLAGRPVLWVSSVSQEEP